MTNYFPNLSFPEITNPFNGSTLEKRKRDIETVFGTTFIDTIQESSNRSQAVTFSSEKNDFKEDEYKRGSRLYEGNLLYPFPKNAVLENELQHLFYFDGSEQNKNIRHLQDSFIGRPLGSDILGDPSQTYVESLLKMKENLGQDNIMNDQYVKDLFMLNTEKGVSYYENAIQDELEHLASDTRASRKEKNELLINNDQREQQLSSGVSSHPGRVDFIETIKIPSSIYGTSSKRSRYNAIVSADPSYAVYHIGTPITQRKNPMLSSNPNLQSAARILNFTGTGSAPPSAIKLTGSAKKKQPTDIEPEYTHFMAIVSKNNPTLSGEFLQPARARGLRKQLRKIVNQFGRSDLSYDDLYASTAAAARLGDVSTIYTDRWRQRHPGVDVPPVPASPI